MEDDLGLDRAFSDAVGPTPEDADAENALQEVEGLRNDKRRDSEHRGQGFIFQQFSSSPTLVM